MSMQKKVVILGDSGVGKTSIFTRFLHHKFETEVLGSMGASFKTTAVTIPKDIVNEMN